MGGTLLSTLTLMGQILKGTIDQAGPLSSTPTGPSPDTIPDTYIGGPVFNFKTEDVQTTMNQLDGTAKDQQVPVFEVPTYTTAPTSPTVTPPEPITLNPITPPNSIHNTPAKYYAEVIKSTYQDVPQATLSLDELDQRRGLVSKLYEGTNRLKSNHKHKADSSSIISGGSHLSKTTINKLKV